MNNMQSEINNMMKDMKENSASKMQGELAEMMKQMQNLKSGTDGIGSQMKSELDGIRDQMKDLGKGLKEGINEDLMKQLDEAATRKNKKKFE